MADIKTDWEIKALVNYIEVLFQKLRGDWSDNRWACREGMEAVNRLKTHLGQEVDSPYRHTAGENDIDYYERISRPLKEDDF